MGQIEQPSNLYDEIRKLKAQVSELRRGRTLSGAEISRGGVTLKGGGGVTVRDGGGVTVEGGVFVLRDSGGTDIVYLGPVVAGDTTSAGWIFKRDNGGLVFTLGGDPASQYWALHDEAGNDLVTDDALSGVGLGRPYLDIPMYPAWDAEFVGSGAASAWPSTTSTTAVVLLEAAPHLWHPRISYDIRSTTDGGTANWRIRVDGATVRTGTGSAAGDVAVPGWGSTITPGQAVSLEVQGWRSGTTGARMWLQVFRMAGRQS